MTEYAVDHLQHQGLIEADSSISIPFGPPTPGSLTVFLYAVAAIFPGAPPPPEPSNPNSPSSPSGPTVSPSVLALHWCALASDRTPD